MLYEYKFIIILFSKNAFERETIQYLYLRFACLAGFLSQIVNRSYITISLRDNTTMFNYLKQNSERSLDNLDIHKNYIKNERNT